MYHLTNSQAQKYKSLKWHVFLSTFIRGVFLQANQQLKILSSCTVTMCAGVSQDENDSSYHKPGNESFNFSTFVQFPLINVLSF